MRCSSREIKATLLFIAVDTIMALGVIGLNIWLEHTALTQDSKTTIRTASAMFGVAIGIVGGDLLYKKYLRRPRHESAQEIELTQYNAPSFPV